MKKKKITIYLPQETIFKTKLLALQRGVSVSKFVESILNEHTKEVQPPPPKK